MQIINPTEHIGMGQKFEYLIATSQGLKFRTGYLISDWFAIRKESRDNWCVDHLPTGYGVPGLFNNAASAALIAWAMTATADWSEVQGGGKLNRQQLRSANAARAELNLLPMVRYR
jgi:hypothetical protein